MEEMEGKEMTADRLIWVVLWVLVICVLFTTNSILLMLEFILLVGLAVFFKWFKYKEKKDGIEYKSYE